MEDRIRLNILGQVKLVGSYTNLLDNRIFPIELIVKLLLRACRIEVL